MRAWTTLLLLGAVTTPLHAQDPAKGEIGINVRSDVTMGIQGTRGTPKARLEALGQTVMGSMGDVRGCYRELVAKRPTTVGAFAITMAVDDGPNAAMKVQEKGGSDPQLKRCVMKVLGRLNFRDVPKPAAAVVTLTFANSRSESQEKLDKAKAEKDAVAVTDGPDGAKRASWTTAGGRVSFHASASKGKDPAAAVSAVIRGLRDGFPPFLDCRRRAQKNGLSSKGDVHATLRLRKRGSARTKVGEITVPHKRVPNCVKRAFKRVNYPEAPAGSRVDLKVSFSK